MNSIRLIILFFFYCHISTEAAKTPVSNGNLTLELVQVLLRHGARTPEQADIDICNFTMASFWEPLGLGQLTNEGKQQEYELGKFLRNRYNNYLSTYYKHQDVYAYASDIDRTQMSLQLVLAGLYSTKGPAVWDSRVKESAIPYVTIPKKMDILLESHKTSKFKKVRDQVYDSDDFKEKLNKFSQFINFVEARTIIDEKKIISDVKSTFDVLTAHEYMRLPLPDWYTSKVKQSFISLEMLKQDAKVATSELTRLGPGPIIKTLVENMNLENKYKNPRKIYLYGGHKSNIAMFIRAHNINDFRYPPFGSALILEKLRDSKNQIYVRLIAWDGLGHSKTLKLGNHEDICPIVDYLKIVKDVIPSNQEIEDMLDDFSAKDIRKIIFKDKDVKKVNNL